MLTKTPAYDAVETAITRDPKFLVALLNEQQAAAELGLSHRTLQAWRLARRGPPVVRAGRRILYRRGDLIAYAEAQREAFYTAVP